jgi:5-hydroxyisourate hydrolase
VDEARVERQERADRLDRARRVGLPASAKVQVADPDRQVRGRVCHPPEDSVAEGRPTISTHVLDLERGVPAVAVDVVLFRLDDRRVFGPLATDDDGRIADLLGGETLREGAYELTFKIGSRARSGDREPFFEQASLVFQVADAQRSYHVPLLLSPFGLSTYRGS